MDIEVWRECACVEGVCMTRLYGCLLVNDIPYTVGLIVFGSSFQGPGSKQNTKCLCFGAMHSMNLGLIIQDGWVYDN